MSSEVGPGADGVEKCDGTASFRLKPIPDRLRASGGSLGTSAFAQGPGGPGYKSQTGPELVGSHGSQDCIPQPFRDNARV